MIMGNPITAINAVDCCALAAMAARKVNTKLILPPPKQVININSVKCSSGLPNNNVNSSSDNRLMQTIRNRLNKSLERIKSLAPAME